MSARFDTSKEAIARLVAELNAATEGQALAFTAANMIQALAEKIEMGQGLVEVMDLGIRVGQLREKFRSGRIGSSTKAEV